MRTSIEEAYEALPKKEFVVKRSILDGENTWVVWLIMGGAVFAFPGMVIETLLYIIFELILGSIVKVLASFFSLFTGRKKTLFKRTWKMKYTILTFLICYLYKPIAYW